MDGPRVWSNEILVKWAQCVDKLAFEAVISFGMLLLSGIGIMVWTDIREIRDDVKELAKDHEQRISHLEARQCRNYVPMKPATNSSNS
jgi:hypothetical protein